MKAVFFNLLAWSILPIMDGLAKHLSSEIHVLEVVWGRYVFMVLISVPITFIFFRKHLTFPKNLTVQFLRSFFLFLSTVLFFYAISILPLADSLTLMFVSPILVTLLAAIVLKEKVDFKRWIAVIMGFVGALIVIRPGFSEFNFATLAAIGAGFSYALYIISTRKLSTLDHPLLTLIFTGLTGAILISLFLPYFWVMPNLNQWLLLIGLATAGTIGHFFLIVSFIYAEASKLAPLAYFEIVTNIIIGYYFFSDFPNLWIWIGLIIIVSSGIYISLQETIKRKI